MTPTAWRFVRALRAGPSCTSTGANCFSCTGHFRPSFIPADTRSPGYRNLRRCRVDRHHALHHVGREIGVLAADPRLERCSRGERADVRSPGRGPRDMVLLSGRFQPGRRPRGAVDLPPALLPRAHEPRTAKPHPTLCFEAYSPTCCPAGFEAAWTVGDRLPPSEPGSLRFFLTERDVLYSARRDALYRARIFHHPWPLHEAHLLSCRSPMLESQGLPSTGDAPLLHQQGEPLKVRVWPRVRVR